MAIESYMEFYCYWIVTPGLYTFKVNAFSSKGFRINKKY